MRGSCPIRRTLQSPPTRRYVSAVRRRALGLVIALASVVHAESVDPRATRPPTLANVAYGADRRQVVDFWKAESKEPTPLVLFVHGGSWVGGDKAQVAGVRELLAAGISFVSVEYRSTQGAYGAGVQPPVAWPMHDVARALQFVRSQAAAWHVDKTRICAFGNSAGGATSLWLAFHDDMADPKSSDPVARESTRLACVATVSAQTTLDPVQMQAWIPGIDYGAHAFGIGPDRARGLSEFQHFVAERDRLLPWIKEYSPYELVTSDDPPVHLQYTTAPTRLATRAPEHSANFGVRLKRKLETVGVPCELVYPRVVGVVHRQPDDFLIALLKPAAAPPAAQPARR
jgi:acetyl esterase/lipase